MKKFNKNFLLLIVFILCVFSAREAFAHATPITYEPEASIILEKAPERIQIYFSERIEPNASGIKVFGPDASLANTEEARVDPRDAHYFGVGIKEAGEGTYTVSWQVVSADDGHFTKGAFSFSVGKETAPAASGQIQIQHITTLPQATAIAIELIGQSILLGSFIVFALIWRPLRKRFTEVNQYAASFEKRFSTLVLAGGILILIGTALFLIIKTLDLQQLRPGSFFDIFGIFLTTVDGYHTLARGILGVLFLAIFFAARKRIFRSEKISASEIALAVVLLLVLLSRARVSHAAASHFYPAFSIAINFIHLIFKGLWVGGLIAVSTILLPFLAKLKNNLFSASALISFSRIVSVAFGLVGVSGAYIIWLHLKDPQYLVTTEWGSRFILLSIFAVLLFAARLYHQFLVDRSSLKLCQGETNGRVRRQVSWLNYTLPLEMFLGIAVIAITSLVIITTPPYPPQSFSFERIASSQGVEIRLMPYLYESKRFLLAVFDEKTKKEIPLKGIVVTLTNEEESIGPIVAETEQRFVGGYALPQKLFSPPGKWKVDIAAQRDGAYDAVASFTLNYPDDIEKTRLDPNKRTLGLFEIFVILSALGIIALSLLLYRFSRNLNAVCIGITGDAQDRSTQISYRPYPSWIAGLAGLGVISLLVSVSYNQLLKTDFQKLCEKNGQFWLQSVPIRNGVALSSDTITGCTLDVGLYHFANEREYKYFLRMPETIAELAIVPEKPIAGKSTDLTVSLSSTEEGRKVGPIKELTIEHDRILHTLIISEDLETFAHIHPDDLGKVTPEMMKEAQFSLHHTFPKAGRYTILVDYVVRAKRFSQQFFVNVAGDPKMEPTQPDLSREKMFDGYRIVFSAPEKIKAGKETKIIYFIEKDGKPVMNLEPYLAASMHLAIIRADLGRFIHTHGEINIPGSAAFQNLFRSYVNYHSHFVPDRFGPKIQARVTFPQKGTYQIFSEFKHAGKIIVPDFTIEVE